MYMLFKTFSEKIPQAITSSVLCRNINPYILSTYSYSQDRGPVTETEILSKLRQKFPQAKVISVEDTSGGCGAMFNISIETNEFKGLSIMKQHRMIYDTLKEQIQSIHGLHLETRAPK